MKFTIEHELLSAQTDSVEVAERLILIIKNMEKIKDPAVAAYLGEYGTVIHDGGNCVETDKGVVIMKKPETGNNRENIREIDDDEEIEIDSVPSDDDPTPEIPHGQKIKSEDIEPKEGTVEEAYMGEHFEIQPKDPEEKPLTPAEQELWDYIQANPDYTMSGACRALNITTANYYWRKRQLFLKGKPVGGTIPFAKKAED